MARMKDEQSLSKCGKMNNNKQGKGEEEREGFDNLIATLTKRLFEMVLHNRTNHPLFRFFFLLFQVLI